MLIRRIRSKYQGDGHEYTVSVDDAWDTTELPGDHAPRSKYYSIKHSQSNTDTFFHSSEGRIFSHEPREHSVSPCECELCELVHSFTAGANALQTRNLLTSLGAKTCASDVWVDELKKRDLMLSLRTGAVESAAFKERVVRLVAWHTPLFQTAGRVMQGPAVQEAPVTGYLKGKKVLFVGVPPSALGAEPYEVPRVQSSFSRDVGIVMVTDHVSGILSTLSDEIWASVAVPGYRATGRKIRDYAEHVRIDRGGRESQKAVCVYVGSGKLHSYSQISQIKGIFRVDQNTEPSRVSGPGGTNKRKVTVIDDNHIFNGGGFNIRKGVYGSYSPDYGRPTRCPLCARPGAFSCEKHLYYTSKRVYPVQWQHLERLLCEQKG